VSGLEPNTSTVSNSTSDSDLNPNKISNVSSRVTIEKLDSSLEEDDDDDEADGEDETNNKRKCKF